MNHGWDVIFPRTPLFALPYVGSDHTPLVIDSGDLPVSPSNRFQFDSSWLLVDGFSSLISVKISSLLSSVHCSFGPMDDWHFCSYNLRKFLRGWSKNRAVETHREKVALEHEIMGLDRLADSTGILVAGWDHRYHLEALLTNLHRQEEAY